MDYRKIQLVGEGKTKRLWTTNDDRLLIAEYSDDAMMYHGKQKLYFEGKGHYCAEIAALLMTQLHDNNIPTDFVQTISSNCLLVKKAEMIPIEVVVRNYAAGSMCKRLGLEPGKKLKSPVLGILLQK